MSFFQNSASSSASESPTSQPITSPSLTPQSSTLSDLMDERFSELEEKNSTPANSERHNKLLRKSKMLIQEINDILRQKNTEFFNNIILLLNEYISLLPTIFVMKNENDRLQEELTALQQKYNAVIEEYNVLNTQLKQMQQHRKKHSMPLPISTQTVEDGTHGLGMTNK
jgi:hypothetical protein